MINIFRRLINAYRNCLGENLEKLSIRKDIRRFVFADNGAKVLTKRYYIVDIQRKS